MLFGEFDLPLHQVASVDVACGVRVAESREQWLPLDPVRRQLHPVGRWNSEAAAHCRSHVSVRPWDRHDSDLLLLVDYPNLAVIKVAASRLWQLLQWRQGLRHLWSQRLVVIVQHSSLIRLTAALFLTTFADLTQGLLVLLAREEVVRRLSHATAR